MSDQRLLGDISACFRAEFWSQDALYVGFLVKCRPSEPRFLQYLTVFLRVFRFFENSLARCFPSAFEAPKVIQEHSKILPKGSQEGPKGAQEASKTLPRGAQDAPEGSSWDQKSEQTDQISAKRALGSYLGLYFGAQERPKRHPRPPQEAPARSPKGI